MSEINSIILNFNRAGEERAVYRALKRLGDTKDVLIVDLVWSKPISFKNKIIHRKTVGEIITNKEHRENFARMTSSLRKATDAISINSKSSNQFPQIDIPEMLTQSLSYHFFRDLDADRLLLVDKLIRDYAPIKVVIIQDTNSTLLSKLCAEKNIETSVIFVKRLRGILKKVILSIKRKVRL